MKSPVATRFSWLRERISEVEKRCGREPESVCLLVASSNKASRMREVCARGIQNFGENHLQPAMEKMQVVCVLALYWPNSEPQGKRSRRVVSTGASLYRVGIARRMHRAREGVSQRRQFAQLRRCQEQACATGFEMDKLLMGMSTNFEAVIAEGATWMCVGTALFGLRPDAGAVW